MDDPTKRDDLAAFLAANKRDELAKLRARPASDLSHSELYRLRALSPPEDQPMIAPLEHRAFAKSFAEDHKLLGAGMPLAALGYYLGKKTGAIKSRTPADLDQVWGAVQGTLQGYGLDK